MNPYFKHIKDEMNDVQLKGYTDDEGKFQGTLSMYGNKNKHNHKLSPNYKLFSTAEFINGVRIGAITLFDKSGNEFKV